MFLFFFCSFPRGSASRENGASTRSVARPTPCGARSLATARPAQQTFSASVSATALDEKPNRDSAEGVKDFARAEFKFAPRRNGSQRASARVKPSTASRGVAPRNGSRGNPFFFVEFPPFFSLEPSHLMENKGPSQGRPKRRSRTEHSTDPHTVTPASAEFSSAPRATTLPPNRFRFSFPPSSASEPLSLLSLRLTRVVSPTGKGVGDTVVAEDVDNAEATASASSSDHHRCAQKPKCSLSVSRP